MKAIRCAPALVVLVIFSMIAVPAMASSADSSEEIHLTCGYSELVVNAGDTKSVDVVVANVLPRLQSDLENTRLVSLSCEEPGHGVTVKISEPNFTLGGKESRTIKIDIVIGRYAPTTVDNLKVVAVSKVIDSSGKADTRTELALKVDIESPLSSGDAYNRIMGIFENTLGAPYNTPAWTAVITFACWIVVGLIAMVIVVPILFLMLSGGNKEEEKKLPKKTLMKLLFCVVILYATGSSLRVYGASEGIISFAGLISRIMYVLLGAFIGWKLYQVFLKYVLRKVQKNLDEDGIETLDASSDLEPLFSLLGKIVLSIVAVAAIMSGFGMDMGAIITSAGLVSLGITYGASNVLNQFFSGVVLLITRPFKAGDVVKIGGLGVADIYEVTKVRVMSTVFDNWSNRDTIIIPNNVVASSTIVNLTDKGLMYKIHILVKLPYGVDVDLAKRVLIGAAVGHRWTVTDGSVDRPYVSILNVNDSGLDARLTLYTRDLNDMGEAASDIRVTIMKMFAEVGIEIPDNRMHLVLEDMDKN